MAFINFLKKYICEVVFIINLILIPFNHDMKVWWQRPVVNDAMGYHAYLPAIFIHQSFNYDFIYEPWKNYYPYSHDHPKGAFVVFNDGKELNKYPPGVAYFQAPFFLLGHAWAKITGAPADGYSDVYMYFLCIGAVFWQYLFFKLLRRIFIFYELSATSFAFTVPLLSFGTNLWFYTQIFGTYSHLYTLISISLFFYGGLKFFSPVSENKAKYFSLMLIGFALALITRNINIIAILLLPCMGFKLKEIGKYFSILREKTAWLGLIISFGLIFSMFLFWKMQTGHWFVDSYPDEHFYWGDPQILKSLFSPHKGWFFWTPLALIGLIGMLYAPRNLMFNFFAVLALVIYITSSWWCWDYGTAFSMRAYIDWYLFVSVGLGFLFDGVIKKKIVFIPIVIICASLSAINLLQSVQFMRGIIGGSSQGIEYTIKNFFRLRPIIEYQVSKKVLLDSKKIVENFNSDKNQPYAICDQQNAFSKGLKVELDHYLRSKKYNHIRYGATVTMKDLNNGIFLCASVTDPKDSVIHWRQTEINKAIVIDKPEKIEVGFNILENIPPDLPPGCKIGVFFWQPKGNTKCIIDDMYIEFIKAGVE